MTWKTITSDWSKLLQLSGPSGPLILVWAGGLFVLPVALGPHHMAGRKSKAATFGLYLIAQSSYFAHLL